jgi:hypothetical protein
MKVNPKFTKTVAKGVLGLVGSAMIGALIKLEKRAEGHIDDHFKKPEEETDTEPTQD